MTAPENPWSEMSTASLIACRDDLAEMLDNGWMDDRQTLETSVALAKIAAVLCERQSQPPDVGLLPT